MDYLIKYNKKSFYKKISRGFSLLELLIVISIFSIFASMTTSTYYNMRSHTSLELDTSSLVEALRFAQSSSQSGKGDSKWGVKIFPNQFVIFKGDTYAGRVLGFDDAYNLSGGVNVSGVSEVVFEKVTGGTTVVGTVTLTNASDSNNIIINEKGTINY
jgi:prepilin-type N-terminal cleavage/methylation domain-containing protein